MARPLGCAEKRAEVAEKRAEEAERSRSKALDAAGQERPAAAASSSSGGKGAEASRVAALEADLDRLKDKLTKVWSPLHPRDPSPRCGAHPGGPP